MRAVLKTGPVLLVIALGAFGCSRPAAAPEMRPGADVTLEKKDGVTVTGRLVEVKPEHVIVETRAGTTQRVPRADIATVIRPASPAPGAAPPPVSSTAAPAPTTPGPASDPVPAPAPDPAPGAAAPSLPLVPRAAESREVTVPAGTVLAVELTTAVASDTSAVEDVVRGRLRRPVSVAGVEVLPAGSVVAGHVTSADRAARVKGRARVAFRFTSVDPAGETGRVRIQTAAVSRLAPATKKKDAAKIGGGAAGGALIGGLLGGGSGAAKGAAIGGAAGTGVVLSTRGQEVRLPAGTPLTVRLTDDVRVRVR